MLSETATALKSHTGTVADVAEQGQGRAVGCSGFFLCLSKLLSHVPLLLPLPEHRAGSRAQVTLLVLLISGGLSLV